MAGSSNQTLDKIRFCALWDQYAENAGTSSEEIHRMIANHYAEPDRFYHSTGHIVRCLEQLDHCDDQFSPYTKACTEFAIWFHDVIYLPGSRDNEQKSAELFVQYSQGVMREGLVDQVVTAIMSTVHSSLPVDDVSKLMVDIDLSGFGQEWEGFASDGENVRKENLFQNEQEYARTQSVFMQKIVDRGRVFSTDYFYSNYEQQAQKNLKQQLEIYSELLNQENG